MLFAALALASASAILAGPDAEPSAPAAASPPPGHSRAPAVHIPEERVRAAVQEHVASTMKDSGVYRLEDPRTGKMVDLEFLHVGVVSSGALWNVHDPGRHVDERASYGCVLFHRAGAPPENVFDVDMLVEPRDGETAVTDVRLHKEKRLVNGKWTWEPRPAAAQTR
jgi:hypothetical protein